MYQNIAQVNSPLPTMAHAHSLLLSSNSSRIQKLPDVDFNRNGIFEVDIRRLRQLKMAM